MLIEHNKVFIKDFINEFTKRFTNFCTKAPIVMSFKTSPVAVHVHIEKTNEIKTFQFDFEVDVKKNIKIIRDWLFETQYPVMIEMNVDYEDYSVYEIKDMVSKGVDPDVALMAKKKDERDTKWRIEKVVTRRDELLIRNLTTSVLYQYRLKMPCILFLKKFREKLSAFDAWELFRKKSILIKELKDTYER